VSDLSGEIIDGRYELLHQIASGGMATIYLAIDTRLDRKVAVKIMHEHLAGDEAFVERFIREAKAAAALSHPNIVAVQDQGWNQGGVPAVFLVMELVEGSTLRDYIFEQGSLSPSETIRYLIPVLSALAAAHKIGIVHRDIKPENILISQTGRVKVADFGLARGELFGNTMTADSSIILGSVSYLSPEQVQRGIADSRSDVYSVGIVAFELLTGEKPFSGESPIQIAYKHVNDTVPAPSTLKSGIPESLDKLVQRATSTNPDDRPRDAGQFLEELREIQTQLDPQRRQLSLELDLPPKVARDKSRRLTRVSARTPSVTSATVSPMALPKNGKAPRERSSEAMSTKKRRASGRVRRNRWILFLLALIIAAGGWYAILGPGTRILTPSNLVGGSVTQAKASLSSLGLNSAVEHVFSEDVAKGIIISSKPGGGSRVKSGATILLTVSKGAERYFVPQMKGLTAIAATSLIAKNSLIVGVTTESFDPKVHKGLVVDSSPIAGTPVRRNTSISLIISKGVEKFPITSYVGKSSDQALNDLTNAGFKVSPTYAFSDTVPTGIVISQSPVGGGGAPRGAKINLVVSKGSESVFIPNVYSLTEANATGILQSLDLVVNVNKIGSRFAKIVIDIVPKVGTKVLRGSTVTITVG
jgi:beta-lactam-binding protein with PASTA domain/tRNA A-37 threonylcarbamoyl transferase component Bud32